MVKKLFKKSYKNAFSKRKVLSLFFNIQQGFAQKRLLAHLQFIATRIILYLATFVTTGY